VNSNQLFWEYFESVAAPRLAYREPTFRKVFQYLDQIKGPIVIVETGCVRMAGNWDGDGQSTLLFDKYINARDKDSICYTVDISPESVKECNYLVSDRVQVNQDDSVHYLHGLSQRLQDENKTIAFAYLDSFDLDRDYWQPSAIHHLKELLAIKDCINKETLIVVDDCPMQTHYVSDGEGMIKTIGAPSIGGKGRLIAEYAQATGAKLEFAEYQAGWTGL
jgi:hypothetical protein